MTDDELGELAILAALAAARVGLSPADLDRVLGREKKHERSFYFSRLRARGWIRGEAHLELTGDGVAALLDRYAAIEAALDPSPRTPSQEECPSVPWLTTVQTEWIDALSINYAVDPAALARLLPAPLVPEVWKGAAWVQVLISSLRDMRPSGLAALFGVCFYQVSYRAAVRCPTADGERRGGYFVRSETNHPVMRAVGNRLIEFRFHDFGAAEMMMVRDGDRLTVGIDAERPGGKLVGTFDTRPRPPPPGSRWTSVDELHEPLIECYDALGVDGGWLYLLTIDRDAWNPWFVEPAELYCEYVDGGALAGAATLDSVLHFRRCGYRWRPLRRVPL